MGDQLYEAAVYLESGDDVAAHNLVQSAENNFRINGDEPPEELTQIEQELLAQIMENSPSGLARPTDTNGVPRAW